MKKNKLYYTTAALMLFCANTSAMEYRDARPKKKVTFVSCLDEKNKEFTQFGGGRTSIRVVSDTMNIDGSKYTVKIKDPNDSWERIGQSKYDKAPCFSGKKEAQEVNTYQYIYPADQIDFEASAYNYPPAPDARMPESIYPITLASFSERKKQMRTQLNKDYEEIISSANQAFITEKKSSLFKRITSSVSNFIYGLLGKKPPLPTPISDSFRTRLEEIDKNIKNQYFNMGVHFTEKRTFDDLPQLKRLSQKFRFKFSFQG